MPLRCTSILVSLLLIPVLARAEAPVRAAATGSAQKVTTVEGITEYAMPNGLRVLLFPDVSKPTVTVNITYFVGARHEGYGETGMAHLLEHMVFKGTPRHPLIMKLLDERGALFNGSTWPDRTNYYETLPASDENLEFAVEISADCMVNSKISAEDLAKEFTVVRNEFEWGENYPTSVLLNRTYSVAFDFHNYGNPTIGSKGDIERVPVEALKAFYTRYYQPDNAMLVIAGKFEPEKALELVQKHFGTIPRPARKLSPTYTVEPVQDGERSVTLRRSGDVGAVAVSYHAVSGAHEDVAAEKAMLHILTNRPSGRLYKALVETDMASTVTGQADSFADPGLFIVMAEVRLDKPLEPVHEKLIEVMEGIGASGVTPEEVSRFREKTLSDIELGMADSQRIAIELSEWAATGDWRMIFVHRDWIEALTPEKVQRFAGSYLKSSNRTSAIFVPEKASSRASMPPTVDVPALVKDYKGREAVGGGETFVASYEAIEKVCQRVTLSNGLKLAMVPKKTRGGAVQVQIVVNYGSEAELKGRRAAAHLLPEMLMRGTRKRSYQQIKDDLDRLRCKVHYFGSQALGSSGLAASTMGSRLPDVIDLLAEILRQPSFPEEHFQVLRKETITSYEQMLQDPVSLDLNELPRKAQPHPADDVRYLPSIKEQVDAFQAVSLDDVRRLYTEAWGGGALELAIVGDFDPAVVKARVEKSLGDWKASKPYERIVSTYASVPGTELVISTPDKQMAIVGIGQSLEVRDDDPDYAALRMVDHLLGAGTKARLFMRLRQEEGLSYGAYSNIHADAQDRLGFMMANAICAPQNADKAMTILLEEIDKLVKEGVPEKELADGKESFRRMVENLLAQDDVVAGELVRLLHTGRTFEFSRALDDRIQKLTIADLEAAIAKHVKPGNLVRIKAGDMEAAKAASQTQE